MRARVQTPARQGVGRQGVDVELDSFFPRMSSGDLTSLRLAD